MLIFKVTQESQLSCATRDSTFYMERELWLVEEHLFMTGLDFRMHNVIAHLVYTSFHTFILSNLNKCYRNVIKAHRLNVFKKGKHFMHYIQYILKLTFHMIIAKWFTKSYIVCFLMDDTLYVKKEIILKSVCLNFFHFNMSFNMSLNHFYKYRFFKMFILILLCTLDSQNSWLFLLSRVWQNLKVCI